MSGINVSMMVRWLDEGGRTAHEGPMGVEVPLESLMNIPHDVFGDTYDETRARVMDKVRAHPMHVRHTALVRDFPDEDVIGYPMLVPPGRIPAHARTTDASAGDRRS